MRRLFTFVCLLVVAISTGWAQTWPGTHLGTEADPYQITSQAELEAFRNAVNDATSLNNFAEKFIKLTTDIALTLQTGTDEPGWMPIGRSGNQFKGTFDGDGHTISGLWINRPTEEYIGLFGYVSGSGCTTNATIKNLSVAIDANGVKGNFYVGGLVGYVYDGSFTNCSVSGNVSGNVTGRGYSVGGLVGGLSRSGSHNNQVTNCYTTGNVSGTYHVGGLAGNVIQVDFTNCYATGDIYANDPDPNISTPYAGGLVGQNSGLSTFTNCYATGKVEAFTPDSLDPSYAGGLVGEKDKGSFTNCYFNTASHSLGRGVGTGTADPAGVTGKPLADMKTSGFLSLLNGTPSSGAWAIDAGKNGGYPYLTFTTMLFGGGEGTETSPYEINTPEHLAELAKYVSDGKITEGKYFQLIADINLTSYLDEGGAGYNEGKGWTPIGTEDAPFNGTFDGAGHTISGLWINRPGENYIGLFGYTGGGAILKNLRVAIDTGTSAAPKGIIGENYVGGLVGYNMGSITNCAVVPMTGTTGTMVTGKNDSTGGLVGGNNGLISNSYATGSVVGTRSFTGGLVGGNFKGTISNSYAAVNVTGGTNYTGGLVGSSQSEGGSATISNCYATGDVEGTGLYTGGLAGGNVSGTTPGSATIINCYATGSVTGTAGSTGGLVGDNPQGTITSSFFLKKGVPEEWGLVGSGSSQIITNSGGLDAAQMQAFTFTFALASDGVWAIPSDINGGYPFLYWQLPTYAVTMTVAEGYTYTIYGETITATTTIAVAQDGSFDFTYTVLDGYEGTGTVEGSAVKAGDTYTLAVTVDGMAVAVTGITKSNSTPGASSYSVTITTAEGILATPSSGTHSAAIGGSFTFYVTLAEGFEGQTPQATVNGDKVELTLRPNGTEWMYVIPQVYDDMRVELSFATTANQQIDNSRLYSRDGQLYVEAIAPAALTVYAATGQTVVSRRVSEGLTTIPLPTGLYIVRLAEQTVRIIVRK